MTTGRKDDHHELVYLPVAQLTHNRITYYCMFCATEIQWPTVEITGKGWYIVCQPCHDRTTFL